MCHIEHLGVYIDRKAMGVYVIDSKVERMKRLAKEVLVVAQRNARLVPLSLLRMFCGVCASLNLVLPMSRFYTSSVYDNITRA